MAEGVIMEIGGWRTRSVFERYAIKNEQDLRDAAAKMDRAMAGINHDFEHDRLKMANESKTESVN